MFFADLEDPVPGLIERPARRELHNERPVTVRRWQHPGDDAPDSGHVTLVTADDGVAYGYTDLSRPTTSLPTAARAEKIGYAFFRELDEAHAAGLSIQWIDVHDEFVTLAGRRTLIRGLKVKTRHTGGLYTWAVVADGRVITYERDIEWDFTTARRKTRMWLHNDWILAYDGDGPQPAPPKAVA